MRWWTSDPHFGHANIIRYTGRPYASVTDMDRGLVERWNDAVGVDDEVWLLGDYALGRLGDSLTVVRRLHGRVTLVPGNHDRAWSGHRKGVTAWTARYRDAGFAAVVQGPVTVEVGERRVVVDHFPYEGDSHGDDRYRDHRPEDHGDWLLHGHVHSQWRQRGRQVNVGVDAWGGRPVREDVVVATMAAGPADLDPLPWD